MAGWLMRKIRTEPRPVRKMKLIYLWEQSMDKLLYLSASKLGKSDDVFKGDIVVFYMSSDHIRAGEIVLFNVDGMEIPIVHRVTKVHEKRDTREVNVLTRGDNNYKDDDRFLYAPGQRWLSRRDIKGRAVVLLPYVGWLGIILAEKPMIKFIFYALCFALHFKG